MSEPGLMITIEKFIIDRKTNRVLIKSREGNYFMDFSVHSFMERTFFGAFISLAKLISAIVPAIRVNVNKIIT